MVFNFGDIVYDALVEAVGGEIDVYPLVNPDENGKLPFIVYRRSGYSPDYSKGLYAKIDTYYYSIAIVSDKYKDGIEIGDKVINAIMALTGKSIDGKHIQSAEVTNATESVGDDILFVQDIDFQIKITR
jgi:hypothetical protein